MLLGVHVFEGATRILKDLIRAGKVDLVGAGDVAKLGAAFLLNDLDRSLSVFKHLEVYITPEDATPKLKCWLGEFRRRGYMRD